RHAHIGMANDMRLSILREMLGLKIARGLSAFANHFARFTRTITPQLLKLDTRDFDMDINAVQ
ncbi:MAG TPA: hypothetical protein VLZ89_17955, partial [Anaerolineales bacterium]|nr:hypothetical protein [Anaerolineales bacterium]